MSMAACGSTTTLPSVVRAHVPGVACTGSDRNTPSHYSYPDVEADLIIVGFGAAGMAVAVTAHERGGKVLILEKAPENLSNYLPRWAPAWSFIRIFLWATLREPLNSVT